MEYKLAVIPGDGIGPDGVEQTLLVPATSGQNGPCWACGRPWGSSPTSAPPCSLSSWRTPPP